MSTLVFRAGPLGEHRRIMSRALGFSGAKESSEHGLYLSSARLVSSNGAMPSKDSQWYRSQLKLESIVGEFMLHDVGVRNRPRVMFRVQSLSVSPERQKSSSANWLLNRCGH